MHIILSVASYTFVPSVVDKVPRTPQRGNWVLLVRESPTKQSAQFSVGSFGLDFLLLTREYSDSLDIPKCLFSSSGLPCFYSSYSVAGRGFIMSPPYQYCPLWSV